MATSDPAGLVAALVARQELPFLRLLTCGSVDDGKSTLLGRLLYDSGAVLDDQLVALRAATARAGTRPDLDLAFLVDGLAAEREQGITIDVAYRHLFTRTRRFLLVDAPGHERYTRNMATGASLADVALLLVDAERGVREQTLRHLAILAMVGVGTVILAVNKMDRVAFAEPRFAELVEELRPHVAQARVLAIPLVAVDGDNVVHRSVRTPWYSGPTLLEALETIVPPRRTDGAVVRFPIQTVARTEHERVLLGTLHGRGVQVGDRLVAEPSGVPVVVTRLYASAVPVPCAAAGTAVGIVVAGDLDLARGQVLAEATERPSVTTGFRAEIVWFGEEALRPSLRLLARFVVASTVVRVEAIERRELGTGRHAHAECLEPNDLGQVAFLATAEIACDAYREQRTTGAFLLIDERSKQTVGAGVVVEAVLAAARPRSDLRTTLLGHPAVQVWLSGSAGEERAVRLEAALLARGVLASVVVVAQVASWRAVADALLAAGVVTLVVADRDAPPPERGPSLHVAEGEGVENVLERLARAGWLPRR